MPSLQSLDSQVIAPRRLEIQHDASEKTSNTHGKCSLPVVAPTPRESRNYELRAAPLLTLLFIINTFHTYCDWPGVAEIGDTSARIKERLTTSEFMADCDELRANAPEPAHAALRWAQVK